MSNYKTNKAANHIKVTGVANHLNSLYVRMWSQWVETPNESYYILEGKKVTLKEMDCLYPVVDLVKNGSEKGQGLDSRTNFY